MIAYKILEDKKIKIQPRVYSCNNFEIGAMNVSQFAIEYSQKYKELIDKEMSREYLIRGACLTNLKTSIKKEYKKFIFKKVLECGALEKTQASHFIYSSSNKIEDEGKIPSSAINDFSNQFFGEKIDNNFIVDFKKDCDYSKFFIKKLRRNGAFKVVYKVENLTDSVVEFNLNSMFDSAIAMFKELIKIENLYSKPNKERVRKKI